MKSKGKTYNMSQHPLDLIESEINHFLDDRYPNFIPWKTSVPEAERDILAEVVLLFKKYLPNESKRPVVTIDDQGVIRITLEEIN